ncbi:MAG: hypothetical protein ACT4P5_02245, partial [Armatimonadota bacterium]
FTGDTLGRFDFYAPDGDYDIRVSGTGVTAYTIPDVTIADDKRITSVTVLDRDAQVLANAFWNRNVGAWHRRDTGQPAWRIEIDVVADALRVYRAPAGANPITWLERFFVKDAGVAIGSGMNPSTTGGAFHSRTETVANRVTDFSYAAGDINGWLIRFFKARGDHATPALLSVSDVIGDIQFHGHTGAAFYFGAAVRAVAGEIFSATAGGTDLEFYATRVTTQVLRRRFLISSGVTNAFEFFNADGTSIAQLQHAPADGNTGLLITRNVAAVTTVQQVSMGAVDSGGTGFKLLRVPN